MKNLNRVICAAISLLFSFQVFSQIADVEGDVLISGKISGVHSPLDSQDAVTKAYVDDQGVMEKFLDAGLNGTVEDINGNVYKTIKIGGQVWMAENLKTSKYNDGTPIPLVVNSVDWSFSLTPAYCWYDNDSLTHAKLFGALYNFFVGSDTNSRNVCPVGWHVPSGSDWLELKDYLIQNNYGYHTGPNHIEKSLAARNHWVSTPNEGRIGNDAGTNNSSGFSGLPGGFRTINFDLIGTRSRWWSSSFDSTSPGEGILYQLSNVFIGFATEHGDLHEGCSIRCLKD